MWSAVPVSISTIGYIGYSSSLPFYDNVLRPRIPTVGYIDYSSLLPVDDSAEPLLFLLPLPLPLPLAEGKGESGRRG
jgi:hypothetical protein